MANGFGDKGADRQAKVVAPAPASSAAGKIWLLPVITGEKASI
jgi:hypothetical protein